MLLKELLYDILNTIYEFTNKVSIYKLCKFVYKFKKNYYHYKLNRKYSIKYYIKKLSLDNVKYLHL